MVCGLNDIDKVPYLKFSLELDPDKWLTRLLRLSVSLKVILSLLFHSLMPGLLAGRLAEWMFSDVGRLCFLILSTAGSTMQVLGIKFFTDFPLSLELEFVMTMLVWCVRAVFSANAGFSKLERWDNSSLYCSCDRGDSMWYTSSSSLVNDMVCSCVSSLSLSYEDSPTFKTKNLRMHKKSLFPMNKYKKTQWQPDAEKKSSALVFTIFTTCRYMLHNFIWDDYTSLMECIR